MRALLLELEETLTSEAASELELPYATPLASTNDPLFWPSHLGVMRVWHALRLRHYGRETSAAYEAWDWGESTAARPTIFNRTSSCYGRNVDDVLPFRDFMNEERREAAAAKGYL